ncbi:MAG TPA: hypothetical protein VF041_15345 [Gemmatimonadaceae bacterium]
MLSRFPRLRSARSGALGIPRLTAALVPLSALGVLVARPAAAQSLVARADTLLIAGRVFAAESLYYDAVRMDPRNPATRLALGRYLAERGALRVGAVLMEEARYFGGDPAEVARQLAPVYERMRAYGALAALPASPLPYPERVRAEWLRDHPPTVTGPDSGAAPYEVSDSHPLGQVELRIGGDTVRATIDARVRGLVVDTSWVRRSDVRHWASRGERDPRRMAGVVPSVGIGGFVLGNVVARFAPLRSPTTPVIGLDVLARLAPTFDPKSGRVLLRADGRVPRDLRGWRISTLDSEDGLFVVKSRTLFPVAHPDVQRYLHAARWTLDERRGEIVVEL